MTFHQIQEFSKLFKQKNYNHRTELQDEVTNVQDK